MKRSLFLRLLSFAFCISNSLSTVDAASEASVIINASSDHSEIKLFEQETTVQELIESLDFLKSSLFQYNQKLFVKIAFFIDTQVNVLHELDSAPSCAQGAATISLLKAFVEWQRNAMLRLILLTFDAGKDAQLSYEEFLDLNALVFCALCEKYEEYRILLSNNQTTLDLINQEMNDKILSTILVDCLPRTLKKNYCSTITEFIKIRIQKQERQPTLNELLTTNFYLTSQPLSTQVLQLINLRHQALVQTDQKASSNLSYEIPTILANAKAALTQSLSLHGATSLEVKILKLIIDELFVMLYEQTVSEKADTQLKTNLLRIRTFICRNEYFQPIMQEKHIASLCAQFDKMVDDYLHQNQSPLHLFYKTIYPLTLQVQMIKKSYESKINSFFYTQGNEYHLMFLMLESLKKVAQEIKQSCNDQNINDLCNHAFSEINQPVEKKSFFTMITEKFLGSQQKPLQALTPFIASKLFSKFFLSDDQETQSEQETKA